MVKGISRQVIVVHATDKALFDQAIFILKDKACQEGVTDEALLKQAKQLMGSSPKRKLRFYGPVWACGGALLTGMVWLLTVIV